MKRRPHDELDEWTEAMALRFILIVLGVSAGLIGGWKVSTLIWRPQPAQAHTTTTTTTETTP